MRNGLQALTIVGAAMIASSGAAEAAAFNLRVSLEHGYYLSGTVEIDTVAGTVTGESSTLFRNGVPLSSFASPNSQGLFAPGGGIAPSYLFASSGTNGYTFVGAVPNTNLTGYGGGEVCALTSAIRCAYSDVFFAATDIANAVQGVLLPVGNTIRTFALEGTFANGDNVTGTVVIDTTAGYVLDEHATLYSHGVVVDEFFNPHGQSIFAPGGGVSSSYLLQSLGAGGVLLNLGIPGISLIGYGGGDLCATGNGLTCAYSDIFTTATSSSNAVTARLIAPAAIPEPSTVPLMALGLLAGYCGWRRDRRRRR